MLSYKFVYHSNGICYILRTKLLAALSLSDLAMTNSSCPVGVGLLNRKAGSKKKKNELMTLHLIPQP